MASTRTEADALARLQAVQARVRTLVQEHGWFGDAIRAAFDDYSTLVERFATEESAMRDRERRLARKLLEDGRLFDPKARDNGSCLIATVRGLCPVALAGRLAKHEHGEAMPRELEREGAAAALAAFDREEISHDRGLPEKKRQAMAAKHRAALDAQTDAAFIWRIVVSRPRDWVEPADPRSLDRAHLARFTDADYRTIALYRLGGLADVGALRPILLQPTETGDVVRDVKADLEWSARLPIENDRGDPIQAPLSAGAFPADVAEQMLQDVETWVKSETAKRAPAVDATKTGGGNVPVGKRIENVFVWTGAEHSDRTIRLARTRSAYLEAHGNVCAALKALEKDGHAIGKSTFYDHLKALDTECRGWRDHLLVSGASGIPENGVIVRKPRNSRGNSR
ncbi:MAG TPA: hypothetical protein VF777_00890 [Phycisphaerales bacterium]